MTLSTLHLPDRIKARREEKKLSQGELGKLAGMHQAAISRLERAARGNGGISLETFVDICNALGADPREMLRE